MKPIVLVFLFASAISLVACSGIHADPVPKCLMVSCENAARIRVHDAQGADVTEFNAAVDDGTTTFIVRCPVDPMHPSTASHDSNGTAVSAEMLCSGSEFQVGTQEPKLRVTVDVPSRSLKFDSDLTVVYDPVFANGEDCGITCHQAKASVVVQ